MSQGIKILEGKMTKIEQWQKWAKQQKILQEELDKTEIKFYSSIRDPDKNGRLKYDASEDKIIICINFLREQRIELPVYAGKELLSVLKQLYE